MITMPDAFLKELVDRVLPLATQGQPANHRPEQP